MKTVEDLIRQHPFVQGLDDGTIALIAGCAKNTTVKPSEYLFREGGPADYFYLIRHGTVALEMYVPNKGSLTFLTVKSGEILGANWLFPPYRWSFDARAVELTRALAFDAECLRAKCESDHHVGYELMKRFVPPLVQRLEMARFQSAEMYEDGSR